MILPRSFRQPRIAIVGFGDVGKRLMMQRALGPGSAMGPRLIAISRGADRLVNQRDRDMLANKPVRFLAWDLDRAENASRLAAIAERWIVLVPPSESGTKDHRSKRLVRALRCRPRSFVGAYISTTGVYGDHRGAIVDETSTCKPKSVRSQRRLDAEHHWRSIGFHVLRVPGIYAHDRLPLARLAAGQPALCAEDDVYTNHIHADDLARIAYRAAFRGRPGRVTNAVDQSEMKMADYFDAVADACGLPRPARISRQDMQALGAKGLINPMMLDFLSESRRVRTKRLSTELGIGLTYPTVAQALMRHRPTSGRAKEQAGAPPSA